MSEHFMDVMVRNNFPVVAAKHLQRIEEPAAHGQRFIVGRLGLYREVSTPWLLSRVLVGATNLPTPYGEVEEVATLKCGSPPSDLWSAFIKHARKVSPVECAGLMIWNASTGLWRLAIREVTHASSSRVDYMEPVLVDDEIAVVDVHSHGLHPAFFSSLDNHDDQGSIKVSAVIGRLDQELPEVVIRLVCIESIRKVTMDRGQLKVLQEAG
jgi:PRTRC genetic system protein A